MPATHGHGNPNWTRDETLLVLDLVLRRWPKLPGKNSQEVQALSELLRGLPIHSRELRNATFRNVDGVYLKIQNLASLHPDRVGKGLRTSETDRSVWRDFASDPERVHRLASQIIAGASTLAGRGPAFEDGAEEEDEYEAVEGKILSRLHRIRERSRGFRRRVLEQTRVRFGVVACESCGLTAPPVEDEHWILSIFELHHRLPLADAASAGPTTTRLVDFSVLCANCHRAIHAIMHTGKCHVDVVELSRYVRQIQMQDKDTR